MAKVGGIKGENQRFCVKCRGEEVNGERIEVSCSSGRGYVQ
jgi:hypothetical protein